MARQTYHRENSLWADEISAAARCDIDFALAQDEVNALVDHNLSTLAERTSKNARYTVQIFEFVVREYAPHLFELPLRHQLTPDMLRVFHDHLSRTNNGQSVADHFGRLLSVAKRLRPEVDIEPICRERSLIDIPARTKIVPELSTREIYDAGLKLTNSATHLLDRWVSPRYRRSFESAVGCRFRDGLMISFAALCMPRTENLASMKIDIHFRQGMIVDRLHFAASETKPRKDLSRQIPLFLKKDFDLYLRMFRPLIHGAEAHDWLWPSPCGGGFAYSSIQACFKRRLRALTGKISRVHDCRRAGGNAVIVSENLDIRDGQSALDHADLTTTEIYISVVSDRGVGVISGMLGI